MRLPRLEENLTQRGLEDPAAGETLNTTAAQLVPQLLHGAPLKMDHNQRVDV